MKDIIFCGWFSGWFKLHMNVSHIYNCMCFLVGIFKLKTPRQTPRAICKTLQPHTSCESCINSDFPHPWTQQTRAACIGSALAPQFWSKFVHRTFWHSDFSSQLAFLPRLLLAPGGARLVMGSPSVWLPQPLLFHHVSASRNRWTPALWFCNSPILFSKEKGQQLANTAGKVVEEILPNSPAYS